MRPEECDLLLFEVIDTGDIEAAVALYEPDATFVVGPETVVSGHAAIREVLKGMIAANATGRLEAVSVVESADGSLAFTRAKGSSTGTGPDGEVVTTPFHSIEVVRKQADGTWRIAIDDPSATGLATSSRPTP
jgi:uncharacterized protein (TIGR02246 family)